MDGSLPQYSATATTTSSAASPRLFWVGMAVFLIVMVVLGFGSTCGHQLVLGKEISGAGIVETDWVIHLHAAIFVGWMALLLGQTVLAARGRLRAHMTLGSYGGIALGAAVVVVGSLITYTQMAAAVAKDLVTWAEWPRLLLGTLKSWYTPVAFPFILALALYYRREPAVHKRYMVFGTILLVVAATSRMKYLLGAWANTIGIVIMVAPLIAYDLYSDRRIRRATLIGTGLVGINLAIILVFG